jgi:hypothetical protein
MMTNSRETTAGQAKADQGRAKRSPKVGVSAHRLCEKGHMPVTLRLHKPVDNEHGLSMSWTCPAMHWLCTGRSLAKNVCLVTCEGDYGNRMITRRTKALIILLPWIILDAVDERPARGHCEFPLSAFFETSCRRVSVPGY